MTRKKRPLKPKNAGCPQWILDKIKQIRIQATTRTTPKEDQEKL